MISLFFLICLNVIQLQSQSREIILTGLSEFSLTEQEKLRKKFAEMNFETHGYEKQIQSEIKEILNSNGFYFFSVDSINVTVENVKIGITKGPRSIIRRIQILPDSSVVRQIVSNIFIPEPNSVFFPQTIDKISLDILDAATQLGFPFTTVIPKITAKNSSNDTIGVEIQLLLENLERVQPNRLEVVGNEKIKTETIRQIAQFNSESTFSEVETGKLKDRLLRSGYFEKVSNPILKTSDGQSYFYELEVTEKLSNNFDGIIGYVPEKGNSGDGYFTGLVNINLRNFLGNARKLNLKWMKEDQYSQEIYAMVTEPWIFSVPLDFSFEFHQRNQDTLFLKRNLNYDLIYRFFELWGIGASVNTEFVNSLKTTKNTDDPFQFNTEKYLLGLSLVFDSRNDFISPRKGIKVAISNRYGWKNIVGADSLTKNYSGNLTEKITVSEINAENYFSFYSRHVIASRFLVWFMETADYDLSDLFQFGGIQNLRGYRENQFQGNRVALLSNEYRFLLSEKSYFMTFFDLGFVGQPEMKKYKISAYNDVFPSYGFGALLNSGIGNIRLIFAMGKDDTFSTSKVHIGIQNDF